MPNNELINSTCIFVMYVMLCPHIPAEFFASGALGPRKGKGGVASLLISQK